MRICAYAQIYMKILRDKCLLHGTIYTNTATEKL